MSLLDKNNSHSMGYNARNALVTLIQTNLSLFGREPTRSFLGMEALSDSRNAAAIHTATHEVVSLLKGSPEIAAWIESLSKNNTAGYLTGSETGMALGMEGLRTTWMADTYERIALSLKSQMNPHETVTKYNNVCPQDSNVLMAHSFGGSGSLAGLDTPNYAVGFGMESFDPAVHLDFIASSALINAQTAIPGGFEEVFFPTISLPPAQSGFDISVQVPKILITQFRNAESGAPFNLQKINLVEAAYNPAILTSNSIVIVPIATGADTPSQLVPQATVPSWPVEILGQTVQSRPIVFNEDVGLIELSTFAATLNNGVMDSTDALYTNVGIKDVYFMLTLTTGIGTTPVTVSAVIKNDVSNVVGTLLQQKTIGRQQSLQTVATIPLFINKDFIPVSGSSNAAIVAVLESLLGISAGTPFTIQGSVRLSAQADTEIGSMNVDESQPSIVAAYSGMTSGGGKTTYNIASLNSATVSASITMIGWTPSARRTNSNLRTNGTIIDANNIVNYRLPINVFPPFTARTPINQADQVTYETLGHVTSLWASGQCFEKLLQMESWLEVVSGTPMGVGTLTNICPIMGGEFVIPTYRADLVNLPELVNNWQSKDTLVNIRAAIQTALQCNSLQLYMDSGYSSALQMLLSDLDAYETIIVTDPMIAQYMMEAGDIRTFGDGRKYIVTKSNNMAVRGKIYYSFRLIGSSDLVHPMSFGCKLVSPNVTY